MAIGSLKDLYIDQLQDLYSANVQAAEATRRLAGAAGNADLKAALESGVRGIEKGTAAIDGILRHHRADPEAEHCRGMEGLVAEAEAHALEERFTDPDVKDAMIITQYQRMVHYGIAGYGCVASFARRLGLKDDAETLGACLEQTRGGDKHMTEIAETEVNPDARH